MGNSWYIYGKLLHLRAPQTCSALIEEFKSRVCFIIPEINSRDEDEITEKNVYVSKFQAGYALDPGFKIFQISWLILNSIIWQICIILL